MTDPSFIVDISTSAGGTRAAVNGFQIIGHGTAPEPSTGLLALLGTGLSCFCRKRTH